MSRKGIPMNMYRSKGEASTSAQSVVTSITDYIVPKNDLSHCISVGDVTYFNIDKVNAMDIVTVLQYMSNWTYQKILAGSSAQQATEMLAAGFVGILKHWWKHVSPANQQRIFQPRPALDGIAAVGDPVLLLIETLYKEFVGAVEDQTTLAFLRTKICDLCRIFDFFYYCRNLVYIVSKHHEHDTQLITGKIEPRSVEEFPDARPISPPKRRIPVCTKDVYETTSSQGTSALSFELQEVNQKIARLEHIVQPKQARKLARQQYRLAKLQALAKEESSTDDEDTRAQYKAELKDELSVPPDKGSNLLHLYPSLSPSEELFYRQEAKREKVPIPGATNIIANLLSKKYEFIQPIAVNSLDREVDYDSS
ncbi:hypothetical protein GOP47_0008689 [Adiantum capillus-veneris]|uniref:DUF7746 domain-containing protein n=1 Tax=Adiantum capillus-veneris TaxID=13818 RepID=A0A9D4UZ26_ADICA|nr:hypothetical protein GOP47_0008689 [Adiantum capillus-veneris]